MKRSDSFVAKAKQLIQSYWFIMAIFLILAAFALTFFLELRYFQDDFGRTWQFVAERPLVFLYNAYLILLALLFLVGLTRRPAIAVGVMLTLFIAVSFVSAEKFSLRGVPLLPEDLLLAREAGELSGMIDVGGIAVTAVAMVVWMGAAVLLNIAIGRAFRAKIQRQEGNWWQRFAMAPRLVLIVTAMALMIVGTDFVRNNSGRQYEAIPWLDSQLVAWSQTENYDNNGFILGFLYNLQKYEQTPPDGYSAAAVRTIREKYEKLADESNALRGELDANLVVVLGEAFMDPATVEKYYPHTGGDVVPNLHKIQAEHPSGYMYSTEYGGGTANVEFEVLTGLSNYWADTVPYTSLVSKAKKFPSIASYLRGEGFATTAIHPYVGAFYKRDFAYVALDIERFITEQDIRHKSKDGGSPYLSDQSAYAEVAEVLAEDAEPQFVMTVTMQNHSPYLDWVLGEGVEPAFRASGDLPVDQDKRDELAVYYSVLHLSDGHLGEFLDGLQKSPEHTVVLFFGDHLPGLFPEIYGSTDGQMHAAAQMTPYFVFTNYDTGVGAVDLPTTTPNCLVNTTLNLLGAKKPPLFYLLDAVCETTPILTREYLGADSYVLSEAMAEYELVTYDLLSGEKYWR